MPDLDHYAKYECSRAVRFTSKDASVILSSSCGCLSGTILLGRNKFEIEGRSRSNQNELTGMLNKLAFRQPP